MELGEAQKKSPQAPVSSENDLMIRNVDVHESFAFSTKFYDFDQLEMCFHEARKLRKRELDGPESELREKNSQKKRA